MQEIWKDVQCWQQETVVGRLIMHAVPFFWKVNRKTECVISCLRYSRLMRNGNLP